jgi:HEAT repeat protein
MFGFRKSVALWLIIVAAASSHAQGQSVEELKKAGDHRGLVARLGDRRAAVRREAAVALPGVLEKVKDPAALNPIIVRLFDVRFRDPWKSTREYSGRALMHALQRTKDQVVLSNALQPLLDALDRSQVDLERRRYAAVALSVVVMKLERVDLLRPRMAELLAATFEDPDEGVRKYAERALQHTLLKLDHEPTLTIAAHPLAARLDSKDLHFRSYSAVMLSVVVRKIKDRDTLKSLLGHITPAATKDPDKGVRDYAGRAMHHIQHVLKEETKPAAPATSTSGVKTSNSPAAAQGAITGGMEKSKKPGNWRGFVARLKDKSPAVRRQAAVALQQVVPDVENNAELTQLIPPLVDATLSDSDPQVRDPVRFALRHVLRKVENEVALISITQSYLAGLRHKDPQVRAHCAHGLSEIVSKIEAKPALTRMLGPLTAATLRSESMAASDFPGFALRNVLRKTTDEAAVAPVLQSSLAGLKHKDSTMRTFFAHTFHENVSKVQDKKLLTQMVVPLTAASLQVKDSRGSGLSAGDLAYSALKQVLDRVDDQAALKSIVSPMAEALKAKEVKRRRYAAHAVMLFAHKVKDKAALWPLVQPLTAAHFHDPDQTVRRSAGMALERTFGRMPEPN